MRLRRLSLLLVFAAALWATVPVAAAAGGSEGPALRQTEEPEDPEPIPDFWSASEPAEGGGDKPSPGGTEPTPPATGNGDQPASSNQTSTSPGGTAPGSGTPTTGPGAPASADAPAEGAVVPVCDPQLGLQQALRSLRTAVRGRNLLTLRAQPFSVRVKPCVPGTFELSIVEQRSGTVLWRARRDLRTTVRATLRLKMTRAGRRFVARASRGPSRTVRMRLNARLTP